MVKINHEIVRGSDGATLQDAHHDTIVKLEKAGKYILSANSIPENIHGEDVLMLFISYTDKQKEINSDLPLEQQ